MFYIRLQIPLLFVKYDTRNTFTKSKEVHIPTQNTIIINESPYDRLTFNDLDRIKFNRDRTIRCKYIKSKSINIENCDKLIIHYVSHSIDILDQYMTNDSFSLLYSMEVDFSVNRVIHMRSI